MYLIDTDIIIWILRGDHFVVEQTKSIVRQGDVGVSTISIAEIYQHIFPKEIAFAEELFTLHEVYPVDARIARNAGLYWQEYHRRLKALSIADCLIASTAREHNLTLLTLNTRHFPMSDIKVRDPGKL